MDGVASDNGVNYLVGVVAGFGVGVAIPVVVTAVLNGLVDIDGGDYVEVEHIDVGASGSDGGVGVGAGGVAGVTVPDVAAAGISCFVVELGGREGQVEMEHAVAKTRARSGHHCIAIEACLVVGGATPCVGAAGTIDGFGGSEGSVDGEVEDEQGVVGGVDVVDHSVGGVCLAVGRPCVVFTCGGAGCADDTLSVVLRKCQRHEGNGQ